MSLLDFLIIIPLLGAIAMAFGAPARATAKAAAAANAVLGIAVFAMFDRAAPDQFQFAASRTILENPALSYAIGADGMSIILVLLTVIVTLCAVAVSPREPSGNPALYYSSTLLIAAGALGAFLSTDLFFFFAFHELALIPTFLMIGIFGTGDNRAAAWRITIYLGLGSLVLLAGLVALCLAFSGPQLTFDIPTLLANAGADVDASKQAVIAIVLIIGFGVLVSLFPFHSWAAPAYASAPTPTTMMHAGVLKKFGLYGLVRLAVPLLPAGLATPWVHNALLVMLLGNILFVGLVTVAQKRLDGVLANSSVMHMGYAFLGIASGSALGVNGAVLLMFAHGVSIALLFALSARVEDRAGTLELSELGGLAARAPFLGLVFGMAAFASVGLPGFANFAAELLVFFGGFSAFDPSAGLSALEITTVLALWGVVISAVYMLRAYRNAFMGEPAGKAASAQDLPTTRWWPYLLLLALLLAAGLYPNLLLGLLTQPVTGAAG